MNNIFGEKIRSIRLARGESITDVAKAIGKDRTYLSKIENGHEKPTGIILKNLAAHFKLTPKEEIDLSKAAGYLAGSRRKEVSDQVAINSNNNNLPETQINVDPKTTPVLYTDSVFISTSQWGLVLDVAQTMGPTDQQTVVSRIGMSKEHARALAEAIIRNIDTNPIANMRVTGSKN